MFCPLRPGEFGLNTFLSLDKGSKVAFPVNCELEDHAPEGEPLYAIIDDYAANQQKWFDDFVGVVRKMTANGYEVSSLTTNAFDFNSHLDHWLENNK